MYTQDKFKKLWKHSFAQVRSCGLASARHQLPATAFWGERRKTSALILVQWEHFAGPSWKYEGLFPLFLKTPQMQSIGQCMLALCIFNIIYPHPDMKLFFLPAVSGFHAGELGELHFGLGTTPVRKVCWFWSISPYSWPQWKVSLQPTAQPLQRRMVFGTMVTAKILTLKFVKMMLRKLWLSSLCRVANLSHSAYSCQPP